MIAILGTGIMGLPMARNLRAAGLEVRAWNRTSSRPWPTVALAESLAIDPKQFLETIEGGPLGVPYAALKGEAMVKRELPPSFPLELALKDAGLVLEAAERKDLELPVTRAVESQMRRAVEDGHGGEDMAATLWASVSARG